MITKEVRKCSTCYTVNLIYHACLEKYIEIEQKKSTIKTDILYTHH